MESDLNFPEIVNQFNFKGVFAGVEPHKFGHIHDTYFARFNGQNDRVYRYVLQRVNHYVFKQPERVMENILAITTHLRREIAAMGGNPNRETLSLIFTTGGETLYRTEAGHYWRAYKLIENARTYMVPQSLEHVYNAARAYGNFQQLLGDFPVDQLHETIPYFHHTAKRFETFVTVLEADPYNRAHLVKDEIDFVLHRAHDTSVLVDLIELGELPIRVTHNDTKYNNLMIDDRTGEAVCVIDLDTVMPGSCLYDFGDAIRSIANTAGEDEPDLSQANFNMQTFESYTHGYLDSTGADLTDTEIKHLAFSARLMTFECGMRFLTDHLDGDKYFRVHRENHNLDRCRTQFKMLREMEVHYDLMRKVVLKYQLS